MRIPSSFFLTLFLIIMLFGCQSQNKDNQTLDGIWQSIGSGWVLQIQDSTHYAFYDITAISCLPARQAHLDEIKASLVLKEDTLHYKKGIMTYAFTRTNQLPELCRQNISDQQRVDVMYNYEVFAQTVYEHYAFMDLNKIEWKPLYEHQKSKLLKDTTPAALYLALDETLQLLNDNHAYLEATDDIHDAANLLEESSDETSTAETLREYGDFEVANLVANHHLKEDMTKDSWLIKWGKMENNIGFIQIKAMWLYADLNITESLITEHGYVDAYVKTFHEMNEGLYIEKEIEGVRKVMDSVMLDLMNTEKMVIDIRFNGGGQDAVNFEILKRFNPVKRQIVKTKLKYDKTYSPTLKLYLEPSINAYTNPVYVLMSPQSGSAAESFAMGAMAIPHFKRIGSHTQGALSTALEKTLPNGWAFSISNEIYMDNESVSYENIGVPVQYELHYPEDRQDFFRSIANNLEMDKQSILMAIKALEDQ